MRVIVAGCRNIYDYALAAEAIEFSGFQIDEIISGGCGGVDQLGEDYAHNNSIPVRQFQADWQLLGKSAGPIRNKEMAKNADALIAIWDGQSRGTADMIEQAIDHKLKTKVFIVAKSFGAFVIEEVKDFNIAAVQELTLDQLLEKADLPAEHESIPDEDYIAEEDVTGERIEDSTLTPHSV